VTWLKENKWTVIAGVIGIALLLAFVVWWQ
jgi:uncharacterized membrane protein